MRSDKPFGQMTQPEQAEFLAKKAAKAAAMRQFVGLHSVPGQQITLDNFRNAGGFSWDALRGFLSSLFQRRAG
jgi:hypothetical protein